VYSWSWSVATRNFLIVGTQRTGSTALFRALNFHPDIACGSEWTQDVPSHRKLATAARALDGDFSSLSPRQRRRIERVFDPRKTWLGFKLLFRSSAGWAIHPALAPALLLDRYRAFLRWISARPALYVIHIERANAVDWVKSKYLSDATKSWTGSTYPESLRIQVPVNEALRRLASKHWVDCGLSMLRASNPYIRVRYEDFLEDDHAVVADVIRFLECDPARLQRIDYRRHRKQSTRPADEHISNYSELREAVSRRYGQ
jgi:LPS sulfotransferase NodH